MPGAVSLSRSTPACVLACGAFLKNTACLVDHAQVLWSSTHGDLGDASACLDLERSVDLLRQSAGDRLQAVAHDLHPDFHSTRLAVMLAGHAGVPAIGVAHHHAHVAVTLAEQGIEGPVIGIALDGSGLGPDGAVWGGELLWVDGGPSAHRWTRLGHLHPLALPGGDAAAREPWRMACALLHELGRGGEIVSRFAPVVGAEAARVVRTMLERRLNCPRTSSAGRWFDAAAGALGLAVRQRFEAEAAMALERVACDWLAGHPGFEFPWPDLDLRPLGADLFAARTVDADAVGRAAAAFHLALAGGLARAAVEAARRFATRDVVLGGGCFMNGLLTQRLTLELERAGLAVHAPRSLQCGDRHLALGQAWVAACAVGAGRTDAAPCDVPAGGH